jgi:hypothetical protein
MTQRFTEKNGQVLTVYFIVLLDKKYGHKGRFVNSRKGGRVSPPFRGDLIGF